MPKVDTPAVDMPTVDTPAVDRLGTERADRLQGDTRDMDTDTPAGCTGSSRDRSSRSTRYSGPDIPATGLTQGSRVGGTCSTAGRIGQAPPALHAALRTRAAPRELHFA